MSPPISTVQMNVIADVTGDSTTTASFPTIGLDVFASREPQNPAATATPQTPIAKKPSYAARLAACCKRCLDGARLDNTLRDLGKSVGHPKIGEFAADLTVAGTIAAIGNTALNLTSLGRYPRGGLGGASAAGNPPTWQHTVGGATGRALETPAIGRVARIQCQRRSEWSDCGHAECRL